jgi:peptidoglycan/LPS O-acetylase OafA/YrhL
MHRTIDAGPALLALGGLLLLIGLFLPWFDGESAWSVFESLDLALAALGIVAIAHGSGRLPYDETRGSVAVAVAAVVIVAVQLIDPPPVVGAGADLDTGAWFSLVAALLMLAGAALTVARFSISVDVRERERRRRVAAVDRRPAEPAAATPDPAVAPPRRPSSLLADDDQRTQAMPAVDPDAEDATA